MANEYIKYEDVSYLNKIIMQNGKLQILDSSVYESIPHNHLRIFCAENGLYSLPTTELVNWVKDKIGNRAAIEIGAGNGSFAEALQIPATDSHMQNKHEIKTMYMRMGQKTVPYGTNVHKFNAEEAIEKYKPKVVVACWVTQLYMPDSDQGSVYGVDEDWVLANVDTYIHIGNRQVHQKRILKHPHEEFQFPWVFSRGSVPKDNVIYIWKK